MIHQLELHNIGLRFGRSVVLKSVSHQFKLPSCTAVKGPNGSGKSSLLKIISGNLTPSSGRVSFSSQSGMIPQEKIFKEITYAAPYIALPGELSLHEMLTFCSYHKTWRNDISIPEVIDISGLKKSAHKRVADFSSGMRQRVRLILAILQESSLLLLDEPGTNLDENARAWFLGLLKRNMEGRITIIASNEAYDLQLCSSEIELPC